MIWLISRKDVCIIATASVEVCIHTGTRMMYGTVFVFKCKDCPYVELFAPIDRVTSSGSLRCNRFLKKVRRREGEVKPPNHRQSARASRSGSDGSFHSIGSRPVQALIADPTREPANPGAVSGLCLGRLVLNPPEAGTLPMTMIGYGKQTASNLQNSKIPMTFIPIFI